MKDYIASYHRWVVCHRFNPKKNFDKTSSQPLLNNMFMTRKECDKYIKSNFEYIKTRKDLRAYPHGWLMPIPIKIMVTLTRAK